MRGRPGEPGAGGGGASPPTAGTTRLARARAMCTQALRALLRPEGLPPGASSELEAAFGEIGREALTAGPARLGRVRAAVREAPPRLLDWMSAQVIEHPALLRDRVDVEELSARQSRSITTAVGAMQLALVAAASASTLEGGPVLALAIDGLVGQVASIVHGLCDWYNTGSYLVRRLDELDVTVGAGEVRRLTNATLMSKGRTVDERLLPGTTELRLARRWIGHGLVDALPFGSSLGKTSARAAERIDRTDLARLVAALRDGPGSG